MNQDQVKALLLKLKADVPDFSVTFTGKESNKVDGLYKPETREILLHNRNFQGPSRLIYTAIHEFAHHIHFCSDQRPNSTRAHTSYFYALFHELLIKAEEMGLYQTLGPQASELEELAQTIKKEVMSVHGETMVRLGQLLRRAFELCKTHQVNYEDYLDRVLSLDRKTAKWAVQLSGIPVEPSIGLDNLKLLTRIRDPEQRHSAQQQLQSGASPDMIRTQFLSPQKGHTPVLSGDLDPHNQMKILQSKKQRLVKMLDQLQKELNQVETQLVALEGADRV